MTRWNHHSSATLVALLLACSLLIAQWAGLQHRVAHAQLQSTSIVTAEVDRSADDAPDNHLFHSCVLLDASAMGASLPTGKFVPLVLSNTSLPITVLPLVSWQALFTRQFSSRAPPSFS
ncbi:hypothetical protein Q8A64_01525 [Oxalobacteraceae bacterium R-40]|uniref:DUF2946 domain-containing protein n=1 Tax=Keguizhuia sedimenti TaxID=3064264 RepID=A0ABU1BJC5_9BURK|nr:hypothetical protein [Oxalobacteraceae bacterium R-40]